MSFEKFLPLARKIVAEHRAQYKGVYYMKGGVVGDVEHAVGKVLDNPVTEVLSDVAAAATGNPELIPLINAGETAGGDVASGKSIGKSLEGGALAGGEALAGQEALGAVGIGSGNSAVNSALGITDTPAATGLPDIGGFISQGVQGLSDSATSALGGVGNALGISSGAAGDVSGAAGDTASAAPVTPVESSTLAPLSSPGGAAPSAASGAGAPVSAGQAVDLGNSEISTALGGGGSGSAPTQLGGSSLLSPDATSAIGASSPAQLGGATAQDISTLTANSPGILNASGTAGASTPAPAPGSSLLGSAAKYAIPLGGLAYEALRGTPALPASAKQLESGGAATAPLLATETQGLNSYNSGTLSPSQQATVDQQYNNTINQVTQQLANEGVTNIQGDSRYISAVQQAQQQKQVAIQQFLQQSLQAGLTAGGAASSNLAGVAQQQISQNQALQTAMQSAIGQIGTLAAGGIPGQSIPGLLHQPAVAGG